MVSDHTLPLGPVLTNNCCLKTISLSDKSILAPSHPSFEGQNIIDLQDSKGKYVVRDEIELLKENGEGFVTGYWSKPDSDPNKDFKKVAFVKLFKPYQWLIGTGLYVE